MRTQTLCNLCPVCPVSFHGLSIPSLPVYLCCNEIGNFRLGELLCRSSGRQQTLVKISCLKGGTGGFQQRIDTMGICRGLFLQVCDALLIGGVFFKNHDSRVIKAYKRRFTAVVFERDANQRGIVPEALDQIKTHLTIYQCPVESRTPRNQFGGGGELLVSIDVCYDYIIQVA